MNRFDRSNIRRWFLLHCLIAIEARTRVKIVSFPYTKVNVRLLFITRLNFCVDPDLEFHALSTNFMRFSQCRTRFTFIRTFFWFIARDMTIEGRQVLVYFGVAFRKVFEFTMANLIFSNMFSRLNLSRSHPKEHCRICLGFIIDLKSNNDDHNKIKHVTGDKHY